MQYLSRELKRGQLAQMAVTSGLWLSNAFSCLRTLHAMRASLLAKAVASLLRCSLVAASVSQGPKLNFSQLCGRIRMTLAAWMNRVSVHQAAPNPHIVQRSDRASAAISRPYGFPGWRRGSCAGRGQSTGVGQVRAVLIHDGPPATVPNGHRSYHLTTVLG